MKVKRLIGFIVAIIVCELAGIIGSVFTAPSIPTWYASLTKPFFNPPSFLFAPVWTLLYALMGIALYLVWEKRKKIKNKLALILFFFQLILNTLWSILFFGFHNPFLAFAEIILLWIVLLATIIKFYPISKKAAWLLIPYILWVSFASILNFAIFLLN